MTLALVNLLSLIATSLLSAGTMLLAWSHFGRSRVALFWALSSTATALQWAVGITGGMLLPKAHWPVLLSGGFVLVSSALLAMGSREVSGRPSLWRWFAAAAAVTFAWQILALFVLRDKAAWAIATNGYVVVAMAIAACSILPHDRRARTPELAVFAVFSALALFTMLLFNLSSGIGADGHGRTAQLYSFLVITVLPGLYAAMGSAGIFLLAAQLNARAELLAVSDALTGTLNRRGLEKAADIAVARAASTGAPLAIVVADLDHLKLINDTHGHDVGDAALKAFCECMRASIGPSDALGRLSGDEFCVVLPGADTARAALMVDRARRAIAEVRAIDSSRISASFGLALFEHGRDDFATALRRADQALYAAKRLGRDRVELGAPRAVAA